MFLVDLWPKYWRSWSTDQDRDRQITFWSDRRSLFTIFLDHDLDLIVDRFFTDLDRILRSLFSRSLNSGKDCQFQKIQLFRVMFFINLRSVCCRHHQIALYGLTLLFWAKHSEPIEVRIFDLRLLINARVAFNEWVFSWEEKS